jgi:hypothetical protein
MLLSFQKLMSCSLTKRSEAALLRFEEQNLLRDVFRSRTRSQIGGYPRKTGGEEKALNSWSAASALMHEWMNPP